MIESIEVAGDTIEDDLNRHRVEIDPMQRMLLDSSFRDLLVKAGGHLQLCDDVGQIIGYFVPFSEHDTAV